MPWLCRDAAARAEHPQQQLRARWKEFLHPETTRDPCKGLLLALGMQEAGRSTDLMRFVLIHMIVCKNNTALSLLSHSGWPGLSAPTDRSAGLAWQSRCLAVPPPNPGVCSKKLSVHFA